MMVQCCGVSGLKHAVRMDIGNNIANVNTAGYKSRGLHFKTCSAKPCVLPAPTVLEADQTATSWARCAA